MLISPLSKSNFDKENKIADVAELADAQVSGTCGLSPWRFDSSHPH